MGIKVDGLEPAYLSGDDLGLAINGREFSKLDRLTSRERRVLEARVLADKPVPLEDLSVELGIARVRVKQLEARVREKMGADYQSPLKPDENAT